MLAIAYRESRFTLAARPQSGVLQIAGLSKRDRYRATHSVFASYEIGVAVYQRWAQACRAWHVRDVQRCMLNGAAEGMRAARRGYGIKCGKHRKRCDRGASIRRRAWRIAHPWTSRPRAAEETT